MSKNTNEPIVNLIKKAQTDENKMEVAALYTMRLLNDGYTVQSEVDKYRATLEASGIELDGAPKSYSLDELKKGKPDFLNFLVQTVYSLPDEKFKDFPAEKFIERYNTWVDAKQQIIEEAEKEMAPELVYMATKDKEGQMAVALMTLKDMQDKGVFNTPEGIKEIKDFVNFISEDFDIKKEDLDLSMLQKESFELTDEQALQLVAGYISGMSEHELQNMSMEDQIKLYQITDDHAAHALEEIMKSSHDDQGGNDDPEWGPEIG